MQISESFDYFCRSKLLVSGKSPKTIESYQNAKKLFIKYFGNIDTKSITEKECLLFFEYLNSYQKIDTVRVNLICLRQVLRSLKMSELSDHFDPDSIIIPKRQKRTVNYLTKSEFIDFLNIACSNKRGYSRILCMRNRAILMLLFTSGIRVSELCKLDRNSIKNKVFSVIGKSKDPRLCFITDDTNNAIFDYLQCRNDNNPALFLSNYGNRITPNNVRSLFSRVCKNSCFNKITPHTLRHSFATYMLDQNVHIIYLSEFLGHQDISTTKMYTHTNLQKLQQIYEKSMI